MPTSESSKRVDSNTRVGSNKRVGNDEPVDTNKRVGNDEPVDTNKRVGNDEPVDTNKRVGNGSPSRRTSTEETTRRLLEIAAQEFMERGYEAARVNDIARGAGLTAGAVYARWHHKSDVLVAALEHVFEQILPDRRLKQSGTDALQPPDIMAILGASLLAHDELRDVMVQVFGSARNNEAIRACLQQFLNEEADQLGDIVEVGKSAGFCDSGLSTAAISLLCQAIGIGVHLLMSAGRDSRHVPAEDDWEALLWRLINAVSPQTPPLP